MKDKVADFIAKQGLLRREGLYLVALSGGADSVALLLILKDLGYRIEAAHCNFHLRGEESNRDEDFVKNLCEEKAIPLHLIHFDTKEYAALHQVSIEMAARELRYGYFRQLRQDIGAEKVCVAHHRDDAVETLLMNLMRGSGVHGLTGIRIRANYGEIVRPLLAVSRQEIEDYLHSIGQPYVTDSTNLVDDVLRNKIRLNVLPLLEQINPSVAENIGKTARFMQETEKVVEAAIKHQQEDLIEHNTQKETVAITQLRRLPSPELFLYEWLAKKGFNTTQVEQLAEHLEGTSGRVFETPDYVLLIDRDQLVLAPRKAPIRSLRIPEEGRYRLDEGCCIDIKNKENISISRSNDCITIDKAKVKFPLTVRPIENGDFFIPFGMTGRKLVSDYLTDLKCSLFEKQSQLVVTDREGQIIWLVGKRIDNRVRVAEQTKEILQIALVSI